jgi:hypothetical protein
MSNAFPIAALAGVEKSKGFLVSASRVQVQGSRCCVVRNQKTLFINYKHFNLYPAVNPLAAINLISFSEITNSDRIMTGLKLTVKLYVPRN